MSKNFNQRRRTLLGVGLLALAGSRAQSRATLADPPHTATPLSELGYGQVQFSEGPLARQARENHQILLTLNDDSLLRPFRLRAGQHAPGREMGGWYNTYAFAPGATFGQWMSALSRYYAITQDGPTRAKLQRLVRGYAATVDEGGRFYRNNRFPSYTYDKLVGGLLDANLLGGDATALPTLQRTTRAASPYLPQRAMPRNEHAQPGEDFSQHAWDESYTLPENQFLAWRATGERRHLELGRRLLYDEFFGAPARGDNALPGKHAYSHVNALSSAAQAYLSLGEPMYLQAARNGLDLIAAQSFATGGWGPDEHFVLPGSGALGDSLLSQTKSFETPCGAYAHFKLTRYLLRITRDSRYGDSMERVLYNTVLGALPIRPDGRAFYYSDYTTHAEKGFHPDRWPCCSGTLPMVTADYAISTCFTDSQGLWVNLYVPAQVNWTQNNESCALSIETDYPYDAGVVMTLHLTRVTTFTLNFRVPAWSQGASLSVNGRREKVALEPGRFAAVRREWQPADRIELELPLIQALERVDAEHPNTVALRAGPLVLMRIVEENRPTLTLTRQSLLAARRASGHEWRGSTEAGEVKLRPFLDIDAEHYSVYQEVPSA
jgi:uncharacterized protein